MNRTKTWWFAAALLCVGCPGDSDDDTGAGTTDGGPASDDGTTSADDGATTGSATSGGSTSGGSTSVGSTESETGHQHESTGHHDSTGHHETEGPGSSGSDTGQTVCDVIGEGCHDNKTPEGIDCHLVGHDGDEAACMKIFEMCAEICGL